MHEKTRTTLRYAQILTAIAIACCGSNALHAQDDDGILVPGDSNDYVILADLASGQVPTVTVGDKVFSIFTYSSAGDMPEASGINVFGFQDSDNNFGLTLQGAFLDAPGDPNGSWASLHFDVDVSDEGQQQGRTISDAHLFMAGTGVPDNSRISADESFLNTSETLRVFQSTIANETGSQLSDWIDFAETSTNRSVTLLISALAAEDANEFARTSVIDLSFSQIAVPEPSAALLLMCGVMIAGAGRRHRGV